MLIICSADFGPGIPNNTVFHWHVGEPFPPIHRAGLLSIQADSAELEMILAAMKRTRQPVQEPSAATAKSLWRKFFTAALSGAAANPANGGEGNVVKIATDIADAAMHEYLKGNDRA